MIGAIAGDIIGSVYESGWLKTKDFPLFIRTSTFTDDTVLTVATMDCLLEGGSFEDIYRKYFNDHPGRGYGGYFAEWARDPGRERNYSWGNGSAMRVSPVGMFAGTLEDAERTAKESAMATHCHQEGIKGAQSIACAVFLAKKGFSKEDIKAFIVKRFGYDLRTPLKEIKKWYSFDSSAKGSVPVALKAFIDSYDIEDAIRTAVSMGGDSDTLACMSGAISEAYYKEIPPKIRAEVFKRLPDDLIIVIERFYKKYW